MAKNRKKILLEMLKDKDERVRLSAQRAIESIEAKKKLDEIEKIITSSPNKHDRLRAVFALKDYGSSEAVPLLVLALQDKEAEVKIASIKALAEIKNPLSYDDLLEMLKDPDINVRSEVIRAIGKFRKKDSLKIILPFLKVKSKEILLAAIEAIGDVGEPISEKALIPFLKHLDAEIRAVAAEALGKLNLD